MASELYQLRLSGNHTSEYWENVLYFQGDNLSAGDVIHNARDLLSNWVNNGQEPFLNLLPNTCYLNREVGKRQDVAGGIEVVNQYDYQALQGAAADQASSQQLCPIVRLIPPMGTKTAGRFFLPGIAEADVEANTPSADWLSRLSTLMSILIGGMNDGAITWKIAVFSRKLGTHALALDYDTSPIVGWQSRRRKPF